MFSSPFDYNKNSTTENNNSNAPNNSDPSLEELRHRVAIRFLVKRTKRFDHLQEQLKEKMQQKQQKMQENLKQAEVTMTPKPRPPECLLYLGLAPKSSKMHERRIQKKQENRSDFHFPKPHIYECSYCPKIFFHSLLYRKHMLRHLKQAHWCQKCNRGFSSKLTKRRHDLHYH